MKKNLLQKLFSCHLVKGKCLKEEEIALRVDQVLLNDSTSVMACLEFETLKLPRIKIKTAVSYIDHNLLQIGYENANDHVFLQDFAKKHGLYFSRAGNGICHQIHLQRFAIPGQLLIGADSHTPTSGSLGMLAIGTGGLDAAMAMAGKAYYLKMPEIINIILEGNLNLGVYAKDVILEILRIIRINGGKGKAIEYSGSGLNNLSILERATIANMGAELGVTTSIFPSDHTTYDFMKAQKREEHWKELKADEGAQYDYQIKINLSSIEPLVAIPHSPDAVMRIKDLEKTRIDQVFIGSCTNSSYSDLATAAWILKDKTIHHNVSLAVSVGSRQILQLLIKNRILEQFISAGARILECGCCGPCVGIGQVPGTNMISLKTSNRNFKGRSGNSNDRVYLVSPATAAASALFGKITDPRKITHLKKIKEPFEYPVDDSMIIRFEKSYKSVKIRKSPNIKPLPLSKRLTNWKKSKVVIKLSDNITTDDIIPTDARLLSLRSNIPELSQYVFKRVDSDFLFRVKKFHGGIIVAGENYGQGSSREHAVVTLQYLGIKAVIAKTFSRIHQQNLVNFGILPLRLKNIDDCNLISQGDELTIENLLHQIKQKNILLYNNEKKYKINTFLDLSDRNLEIIINGGLLNNFKKNLKSNC